MGAEGLGRQSYLRCMRNTDEEALEREPGRNVTGLTGILLAGGRFGLKRHKVRTFHNPQVERKTRREI